MSTTNVATQALIENHKVNTGLIEHKPRIPVCSTCACNHMCFSYFGLEMYAKAGTPSCRKSYHGFGLGRRLSKRQIGRV